MEHNLISPRNQDEKKNNIHLRFSHPLVPMGL